MASALQTTTASAPAPATDPAKLMTQPERLALVDNPYLPGRWNLEDAAKKIHPSSLPRLIAAHDAALAPVSKHWLSERLKLLWKSSVVNGSFDAVSWLHETGRLLCDLPHDLLSEAIDRAVMDSAQGFMPTVGQIRAIADPRLRERQQMAARLAAIRDREQVAANPPPPPPADTAESTADILKRVWPGMAKHEQGHRDDGEKLNLNPDRECRKPSAADYKRLFGIDLPPEDQAA